MSGALQSFTEFVRATRNDAEFYDCLDGISSLFVVRKAGVAVQFVTNTDLPTGWPVARMRTEANRIRAVEQKQAVTIFRIHSLDWEHRPEVIKHWLRHKMGESHRICFARQATLICVQPAAARDFYDRFHLQGFGGGHHFGLIYNGHLVACITFDPRMPDRRSVAENHEFNLARLAFAGHIPGAASRLFRFACDQTGATKVVTFSDNTYALGAVYKRLGFLADGEAKPEYRVWHPRYGPRHKAFWDRPKIPARLRELSAEDSFDPAGDHRTGFQMAMLTGCLHVWDRGKRRWIWTRSRTEFVTRASYQVRSAKRGGQPGNNNAKNGRRKQVINIRFPVKRGGTSREYFLRRLARDHPAFLSKWEKGEILSVRAAAIAAGIIEGGKRSKK